MTRGNDLAGLVLVRSEQSERAVEAGHNVPERGFEILRPRGLQAEQRCHHFGVGLTDQRNARGLNFRTQLGKVLDDAVMDHRELAVVTEVRVGVLVGRAAVRGPPRVTDSRVRGSNRAIREQLFKARELARALADRDTSGVVDYRNPGRVVPPVLQPSQSINEHADRIIRANISDDSAHAD